MLLLAGCLGVFSALVVGLAATRLGDGLGLLDFPDDAGGRKLHARVTPLVGGIAVAVACVGATAASLLAYADAGPGVGQHLLWFGIATLAMFLNGLADDRFLLSPRLRLGIAMLVLLLVVIEAPDFSLSVVRFSGEDEFHILGLGAEALTLLCLVGLLNAVNMADGKNGIVLSLGLTWSIILLFRLPAPMIPILVAVGAALAVLLWFNMRSKLFLGDGGSYAISTIFGLLSIYSYNHDFAVVRADDVVLMFAVPVMDTIRLVVARSFQRRSPFSGGRDHLHHYLYASVGWPRGLWIYVTLVAVPNAGALILPGTAPEWLAVTVVAYILVLRRAQRPSHLRLTTS
ncbi:MAG: MraY family glycosyltransferase [Janthinobacterium lividum]